MADQTGIAVGLGHFAADRMIVGDLNGWLIEHMLQVVQAERLECGAEAMPVIVQTQCATKSRGAGSLGRMLSRMTIASSGSGMMRGIRPFIRFPGTCHKLPAISIQRILKTSAARGAPQTISMRSALAGIPLVEHRVA